MLVEEQEHVLVVVEEGVGGGVRGFAEAADEVVAFVGGLDAAGELAAVGELGGGWGVDFQDDGGDVAVAGAETEDERLGSAGDGVERGEFLQGVLGGDILDGGGIEGLIEEGAEVGDGGGIGGAGRRGGRCVGGRQRSGNLERRVPTVVRRSVECVVAGNGGQGIGDGRCGTLVGDGEGWGGRARGIYGLRARAG